LWTRACVVEPALEFPRCRDPKDDDVIATAVVDCPCYLLTADRDLYDDADLATALHNLEIYVYAPARGAVGVAGL